VISTAGDFLFSLLLVIFSFFLLRGNEALFIIYLNLRPEFVLLWQIWSLRVCEVWLPLIFLSSVGSFLSFRSLGAPSAHRDLALFPAQICVPGFDLPLVFPASAPPERHAPVLLLPLKAACAGRCSGFDFCSLCLARNCQIRFHHFVQAAALARAAICSCDLVSVPLHLLFPVTGVGSCSDLLLPFGLGPSPPAFPSHGISFSPI
jgi:hypothetical protein